MSTNTFLNTETGNRSIAFIDGSLAERAIILSGLDPAITTIVLDAKQDGLQQMVEVLAGISGLDGIYIFSHGANGQMTLGTTLLHTGNLDDYQSQLAELGNALSTKGDLLLYGCEIAAGETGRQFIEDLARYTGADVAASNNLTGLGGDWLLESQVGTVEPTSAVSVGKLEAYPESLFTPTLVAGYDTANTDSVAVSGDKAYLADWENGLLIFDISNPTKPELIGSYAGGAYGVTVSASTVYMANWYAGITIINANDPTKPSALGGYNLNWTPMLDVAVKDNTAYIANYAGGGLRIVDISSPKNPTLLGSYISSGDAYGVEIVGNTAYIADGSAGLTIVDVSNPAKPALLGTIDTLGFAYNVAISGTKAYIADSDAGLEIIDVSNPANPTLLGSYRTGGHARSVTVRDNTAYVVDQVGLVIIDISNAENPVLLDSYQTKITGSANGVAVSGHYAYVADGAEGLQVIQISQNTPPTGSVNIDGNLVQGQILTATNTLADVDGLGLINYQWQANSQPIGVGNSYQLTANEIGKTITVTAQYTDQLNTVESISSAATEVVQAHINTAPTFSVGDGKLSTDFGSYDRLQDLAVQADGKILVVGVTDFNGLVLARYNADGHLDDSFGTGGKSTMDTWGNSLAVQKDGKIIVAGSAKYVASSTEFSVERFNSDGSLDINFANDGKLYTDFGGFDDIGKSIALQIDGKILVAGYSLNSKGNNDFALARFTSNGQLDSGFAFAGKLTTDFGAEDQAYSVALQSDGKILVAGSSYNGSNTDFAIVRYNTDGSLDASFGTGGSVMTDFGFGDDQARCLAIQADGNILVGGFSSNGHDNDFALVRYDINGSLDNTFGLDGKRTSNFSTVDNYSHDAIFGITLQPDGKIIASGSSSGWMLSRFAIARYNNDGSWDPRFDGDGRTTVDFPGITPGVIVTSALQADGNIVVAGSSNSGNGDDFTLARFTQIGSLDTRFDVRNTLDGKPVYTEGGSAIVLDGNVQIYDAESAESGNYGGSRLTLNRSGLANPQDLFSAKAGGTLGALSQGFNLVIDKVTIGTVSVNGGGRLVLDFNNNATQPLINKALQQIAYSNAGHDLPANGTIDWTFSDGTLATKGSTVVTFKAPNHLPIGNVTINGDPVSGQTLTVVNTLSDADGLGVISYQWQADGIEIGTGEKYTLTANELGKAIKVTARYIDNLGNQESVSSANTSVVTAPTVPGFTITPLTAATTGENGTVASYSFQINTSPTAKQAVVITFSSSNEQEGTVGQPSMTFTAANWLTPQTLTVIGIDDQIDDGDQPYQIKMAVNTQDIFYKALTIKPLNLINADDGIDVALVLFGDKNGNNIKDVLTGGNGADELYGLTEADNLSGGSGNDTLWGGYGNDNLDGEGGDDDLWGEQGNDTLEGGVGNDALDGGDGTDLMDGGAGNDTLDGGKGIDTMAGGSGNDTYYLGYDATDLITDNGLKIDVDTVIMPYQITSYILPKGIENGAITDGTAASNLTGNNSNNNLTGNNGDNILEGLLGLDFLFGGLGNDRLEGGEGDDQLEAGSGKDSVDAGAGNDEIVGGDGAGDDFYIGGTGVDTLKYTSAKSGIKVNLTIGTASGNDIDNDQLKSIENVLGGQGNDTLNGNAFNNTLDGFTGNDTLLGGDGNDTLVGGSGNDKITGGLGLDVFRLNAVLGATNIDTVTDFKVADDAIQLENAIFKKLTILGELNAANFVKASAAADSNDYVIYNPKTGVLSYDVDGNGAGTAQQIALLGTNLVLTHVDFIVT